MSPQTVHDTANARAVITWVTHLITIVSTQVSYSDFIDTLISMEIFDIIILDGIRGIQEYVIEFYDHSQIVPVNNSSQTLGADGSGQHSGIRPECVCFSCYMWCYLKREIKPCRCQQAQGKYLTLSQPFTSMLTPWGIFNFSPTKDHPLPFPSHWRSHNIPFLNSANPNWMHSCSPY